MKCYFCDRDEDEVKKSYSPIISFLEKKISLLENRINDKRIDYQITHGFTKNNFEKLKKIDKNLLNMEINYILQKNYDVFFKLEPTLELLHIYLMKYKPKISETDSLEILMNLYLNEPTDEILCSLTREERNKKEKILVDIEQIKNKIKFYEVDGEKTKFVIDYEQKIKKRILNETEYYFEMRKGKVNQEKILLCPYCLFLLDDIQFAKLEGSTSFRDVGS
jgi:hypothetical protein